MNGMKFVFIVLTLVTILLGPLPSATAAAAREEETPRNDAPLGADILRVLPGSNHIQGPFNSYSAVTGIPESE